MTALLARPALDAHAVDLDALLAHAFDLVDRTDVRAGCAIAERALEVARQSADRQRMARAFGIIADASRALADYPRAASSALEAIELLAGSPAAALRANARVGAALVFFDIGDYGRALAHLTDARDDLLREGDPAVDAACAHAEGMVQSRLGEYALARASFERALRLRRAVGGNHVAATLNSLGVLQLRLAQPAVADPAASAQAFQRALEYFNEANDIAARDGDARLALLSDINIASALAGLGRLGEALERFLAQLPAARAAGDRTHESLLLANAGEACRLLGEYERSRVYCEDALAVAQAAGSQVREQQARLQLSYTLEAAGDFRGALNEYKTQHRLERETHAEEARRAAQAQALRDRVERARREAARLRRVSIDLKRENRKLGRLAREDALTGLANRRAFDDALNVNRVVARDSGQPLAVVLFDLDHFKAINDRFTHAIGDTVLRDVATVLRAHCRASDLAARIGGEEFALLLPNADRDSALAVAERVRAAVAAHDWATVAPGLGATISGGVAVHPGTASDIDLLREADAALYRAKRGGRDRIAVC